MLDRKGIVVRGIARQIVQSALPQCQGQNANQPRDNWLRTVQGKHMVDELEQFIAKWAEAYVQASPYGTLWTAAKEFQQGLISEQDFKTCLKSFVEDVVDGHDDLNSLASQITAD